MGVKDTQRLFLDLSKVTLIMVGALLLLGAGSPAPSASPPGECFDVDVSNPDGAEVQKVAQDVLAAVREVDTTRAFSLGSVWFKRTIDAAALKSTFQQALYHGYAPDALDEVRLVRARFEKRSSRYDVQCGGKWDEPGYFYYSSPIPDEQIILFGEGPEHGNPGERAQITGLFIREGGVWKVQHLFLNSATRKGLDAGQYLALGKEAEKTGKPRIAWFEYRTARELSFISGHLHTGPWNAATEAQQGLKVFDIPNRSPTPWWSRKAGSLVVYHLDVYESAGKLGLLVEYVSRDPENMEQVTREANGLMDYIASHFPEYAEFFDAAYFSPLTETPEMGEPTEPRPMTVRPFPKKKGS